MLIIRLQRVGRTNLAAFRVIVTESQEAAKSGKNVESLGSYNPHTKTLSVEKERVLHWISKGAQVSPTMRNLFISKGILEGKKANVLPRKTPIKKEGEAVAEAAPAAEAPAQETPDVEAKEEALAPEEKKEEAAPTT